MGILDGASRSTGRAEPEGSVEGAVVMNVSSLLGLWPGKAL